MYNRNNHGFDDDVLLGEANDESIYLRAPSWDCDWYWGFGYLGNRDCHYHLDGLNKDKNIFDAIKEHFGDSLTIKDDKKLWTFCELMATFYALQKSAEVLGRGGSHYTTNPCADTIKNKKEAKRINDEVMPEIFHQLHELLKA